MSSHDDRRRGRYVHLFKAVVYRDIVVWLRYPVDAVSAVFVLVVLFGLMFYGGQLVAGQAIEDSIEGLVVGYFLWSLAITAYGGVANDVQDEASWGTLERHFTTPLGFGPVLLAKSLAVVFRTFIVSVVVLVVMLAMTGVTPTMPFLTVLVVALFSVAGAIGIGLAMAGLGVLYKRISNVTNLLQFAFIGLISAPAFDAVWLRLLPLAEGSALLQRAMRDGVHIWEFEPTALALLVGTAVLYLGLGYLVFHVLTRRSRRLGVLGDY